MAPQQLEHNSRLDAPLLDAGEVARILGVPKTWVYAKTRAGRLPHVNVGRYRRYRRTTLDAWITARERGPVDLSSPDTHQP